VGPRASLDGFREHKTSFPYQDSNPESSSPQLDAIPTTPAWLVVITITKVICYSLLNHYLHKQVVLLPNAEYMIVSFYINLSEQVDSSSNAIELYLLGA
jgi:hypothetical protein